ncbi:MAG: AGE family epimerase/isomerase [Verrucomicrobiota bacterium]
MNGVILLVKSLRVRQGTIAALLVLCAASARPDSRLQAATPAAPSRDELLAQAERCERILQKSLIDFYLPACVDSENGGYLESLRDGKFAGTGEKFLTLQARQLWFFSTLAAEGYAKEKALAAAKVGYDFLQGKMLDRTDGGYYSKVTDAGNPRDTRKHIYLNSFALYGLVGYYRASKNPEALEAAKRLFQVLEKRAHDYQDGGYNEFFYTDWSLVTDPKEAGYVGAIGHKTYNTHLHLLESFAELYRVWPDDLLARRLYDLILINTSTVRSPRVESNVDAYFGDWRVVPEPRNLRASYGHDVECVWLTRDAVKTVGASPSLVRNWAEGLCKSSIEFGFDRQSGGFFSGGPLGKAADDMKKVWWVQAEAIVSMIDMFKATSNPEYYDLFARTLEFIERHQVAQEGGWWATRSSDGSAAGDQQRTGPWQAGYHAGRAMMMCAKGLRELANDNTRWGHEAAK